MKDIERRAESGDRGDDESVKGGQPVLTQKLNKADTLLEATLATHILRQLNHFKIKNFHFEVQELENRVSSHTR